MSPSSPKRGRKGGKKVRVPFRRNRSRPARDSDWTRRAGDAEGHDLDTSRGETVRGKGAVSRRRTVVVPDESSDKTDELRQGTVVAMRGLFAEVDDGQEIWPCTVRRILRTRLTDERSPVTIGDRVRFAVAQEEGVVREGVIESVEPRCGVLRRRTGRRIHTMVANVDRVIIVSSAAQPDPKPNLIDRYLVAAHAGEIAPVVCFNKIDLDQRGSIDALAKRYAALGYETLRTSAVRGDGIAALRDVLKDAACVVAGQSGVGKSSLLNAVEPGLRLKIADTMARVGKGRHTTTTATLIRLSFGGYVVDTPGIRTFDLSVVDRCELEAHFVEFVSHVPHCKFPDCTHRHEDACAVKRAVEAGAIHPQRYESYVRLFEEPVAPEWESRPSQ